MNDHNDSQPLRLRPAQEEVLAYTGGRMAISAVPGSGKTFTLSLLATKLIAENQFDPASGRQVLIVTFLNSSVDTFRARIRKRLQEMGLDDTGYDVRTLHSLSLEIVRSAGEIPADELTVLDDLQSRQILEAAVDGWINDNVRLWETFLPESGREYSPQMIARWRDITATTAASFIRAAKNERYTPAAIQSTIRRRQNNDIDPDESSNVAQSPLMHMMAGIYSRYQSSLDRQGSLDYDDLIWRAADLLEHRPDLVESLRGRWPFILEDEAQDSVPLQEILLDTLTGPNGNWVRVGDPNQAITSTFTAAHPRFFSKFIDRPDVVAKTLPNSGRSAPLIIGAANAMLNWTIDQHPVPEVRRDAFRRQDILPTPPGDAQPNPPDSEAEMRIRVYRHREDEEIPAIAQLAVEYTRRQPQHTLAILAPTHQTGYAIAQHLDALNADYDNLLRGSGREREVAAAIHAVLAVLANPLDTKALNAAHNSLSELKESGPIYAVLPEEPEDSARFQALLRSVYRPESILFPREGEPIENLLPTGVASEEDIDRLERLAGFLRDNFDLRTLPIDDLTLALADVLFAPRSGSNAADDTTHELDLAIAYQIAGQLRQWREAQPEWRLPELVAQLQSVATGRRTLNVVRDDSGYEPKPGRISLTTQHSGKGLEWDAVFLVGIDGMWIPGSLDAPFLGVHDFLGGDPNAEATAQLSYLMSDEAGIYPNRTATESAHIEVICERLRLLYVGVTRARRFLHISRSRATRRQNREREAEPATVLGVLYRYLQERTGDAPAE
ncbi:MAG TPA: ATP-dependent helicase [Promineifilum sp.]|nr:ATP-dependent helicase [Promineifilum sp.]